MTREKKQFLSAADMDAWAAEQNEIASHNARIYLRELIDFADEREINWRALGGLERARRLRDQYAHSALNRRHNHRGGNPPRYNKSAIRADVLKRHAANREANRESSWLGITASVAAGVGLKDGDSPNDVLRAVRRYCRDLAVAVEKEK